MNIKSDWQTKKLGGFCIKVPYVSQINDNSCGAAVLEMVYKYYGLRNVSQEAIFNKYKKLEPHGSGNLRLDTDSLVSDASGRGFLSFWARANYDNKEDVIDLLKRLTIESGIPVIVCQKFTDKQPLLGHFRIVVGACDDIIYIHDPHKINGGAFKKWKIDKFMEFWKPTGENVTGGVFVVIKNYEN